MGFPRQAYWSGLPFPSPRGSSWPKDRTYVSCIAGRFFTAEPYVYISYIYTDINISVYSHSKSHLVMEYNLLCMVLDSACYHLVDIYSINIHKEYWSVVFLFVFVWLWYHGILSQALPRWLSGKGSACNAGVAGDAGSIPGSGRSPGEGNGNPLQYSFLGNPMDRRSLVGFVGSQELDTT